MIRAGAQIHCYECGSKAPVRKQFQVRSPGACVSIPAFQESYRLCLACYVCPRRLFSSRSSSGVRFLRKHTGVFRQATVCSWRASACGPAVVRLCACSRLRRCSFIEAVGAHPALELLACTVLLCRRRESCACLLEPVSSLPGLSSGNTRFLLRPTGQKFLESVACTVRLCRRCDLLSDVRSVACTVAVQASGFRRFMCAHSPG